MNFHKRLRKLQSSNRLTFKAIADACGVKYQTVQQWAEDDGTYPRIENLEPLAGVLKTTPWYLLFGIHAGSEAPIRGQKPVLSEEAEELIQCVIRLDGLENFDRQAFVLHQGLLLLQLRAERTEDAQVELVSPSQADSTAQTLASAEAIAKELARAKPSRSSEHAGTKRGGR